jgi:hypothetical protein
VLMYGDNGNFFLHINKFFLGSDFSIGFLPNDTTWASESSYRYPGGYDYSDSGDVYLHSTQLATGLTAFVTGDIFKIVIAEGTASFCINNVVAYSLSVPEDITYMFFVRDNSSTTGIFRILSTTATDINSALIMSSTTDAFTPPKLTSAQRDALTPSEGNVIYNTTDKLMNLYSGSAWRYVNNFDRIYTLESLPPADMTSSTTPSPYVVTQSMGTGWYAYTTNNNWQGNDYNGVDNAYDGANSLVISGVERFGEWVAIDLGGVECGESVDIKVSSVQPVYFYIAGSLDGVTWNELGRVTDPTWVTNVFQNFVFDNIVKYRHFAILIDKASSHYLRVTQIRWKCEKKGYTPVHQFYPKQYTTATLPPSALAGSSVYDTTDNMMKWYNGAEWVSTIGTDINGALIMSNTIDAFTPPKLTLDQRDAITPSEGNVIYNTTDKSLNLYSDSSWRYVNNFDRIYTLESLPLVDMTSATLPSPYVVTQSSGTGWNAYSIYNNWQGGDYNGVDNAYDGANSLVISGVERFGEWLAIDLGGVDCGESVDINVSSGTAPVNFYIAGSLDGVTWNELGRVTDPTWVTYVFQNFVFDNPGDYRHYAILIDKSTTSYVRVYQIRWKCEKKGYTPVHQFYPKQYTTTTLPTSALAGSSVYDTTINKMKFHNGMVWETMTNQSKGSFSFTPLYEDSVFSIGWSVGTYKQPAWKLNSGSTDITNTMFLAKGNIFDGGSVTAIIGTVYYFTSNGAVDGKFDRGTIGKQYILQLHNKVDNTVSISGTINCGQTFGSYCFDIIDPL